MVLKKKFRVVHGWVVGIRQEPGTGRRMVILRQSNGREFGLPAIWIGYS